MSPAPMPAAATSRPGPIAASAQAGAAGGALGGTVAGAASRADDTMTTPLGSESPPGMERAWTVSAAEAIVRMLDRYGVRHVFGLCGDTSLPFYDALYRMEHGDHARAHPRRAQRRLHGRRLRPRQRPARRVRRAERRRRHLPPAGPGRGQRVELARCSASPPTCRWRSRGRYPLTELDQESLFRPLTKWNTVCDRADQVPQAIRSAFRQMTTGRPGRGAHRPALRRAEAAGGCRRRSGRRPGTSATRRGASAADPAAVEAAAAAIAAGAPRRCSSAAAASLAAGATDVLADVATLLDAPVCTTVTGKGSIADTPSAQRRRRRAERRRRRHARGRAAGGPGGLRRLPRRIDDHRALDAARRATCRSSTSTSIRRSSRPTTGRRTRSSAMRGWCCRRCTTG